MPQLLGYLRRAQLNVLGDVTVLIPKRRRNDGPTKIRLIVTNLDVENTGETLNVYARQWAVEVTFKEVKSVLRCGRCRSPKFRKKFDAHASLPVIKQLELACDLVSANLAQLRQYQATSVRAGQI
jgi:hypothetical protein